MANRAIGGEALAVVVVRDENAGSEHGGLKTQRTDQGGGRVRFKGSRDHATTRPTSTERWAGMPSFGRGEGGAYELLAEGDELHTSRNGIGTSRVRLRGQRGPPKGTHTAADFMLCQSSPPERRFHAPQPIASVPGSFGVWAPPSLEVCSRSLLNARAERRSVALTARMSANISKLRGARDPSFLFVKIPREIQFWFLFQTCSIYEVRSTHRTTH